MYNKLTRRKYAVCSLMLQDTASLFLLYEDIPGGFVNVANPLRRSLFEDAVFAPVSHQRANVRSGAYLVAGAEAGMEFRERILSNLPRCFVDSVAAHYSEYDIENVFPGVLLAFESWTVPSLRCRSIP